MRFLWLAVRAFLFLLLFNVIALSLSGYIARDHHVLAAGDSIPGQATTAEQLAAYWRPAVKSEQDIEKVWYEVIDRDSSLTINYYLENKPVEVAAFYRIYDFIRNGYTTHAFALVSLQWLQGSLKARFTTAPSRAVYPFYYEYTYGESKVEVPADLTFQLALDGYSLQPASAAQKTSPTRMTYLQASTYKWRKMIRQPKGFVSTIEGRATFGIALFTGFIFMLYFIGVISDYEKAKRRKLNVLKD